MTQRAGAIDLGTMRYADAIPAGSVVPGAGSQQGFAALLHGFNEGNNEGTAASSGKIQRGYVINPFTDEFAGTIIREGQMTFISRNVEAGTDAGSASADNTPWSIVNLFMINRMLRAGYERGLMLFQQLNEQDPRNPLLNILRDIELRCNDLYSDGYGKEIANDRYGHLLTFFKKQGFSTAWNPLGYSIFASAPDRQTRNTYAYLPMNIGFRGKFLLENVWGPNAAHSSKLFLIHKRIRDPNTGRWGPMAFVPYATIDDSVPPSERRYEGFGNTVEWGDVHYCGTVVDSLGQSLPPNELMILQGIHPSADANEEFAVGKSVPRVEVVYQSKFHGKYFTPV